MSISRHIAPLVLGLSLVGSAASAAPVIWANWTSANIGAGTASGFFDLATDITISYTGQMSFAQTSGGTNYWTQPNPLSLPYVSPLVDNAPPASDIIALSAVGTRTLTFSAPVDNLFFAVVSLNGNGYRFNEDFTIVSSGQGFWGAGTFTKTNPSPGFFQLNGVSGEPHGVIRFNRAVTSISWTAQSNENWNGFTVGTYGAAPEPGTLAVLLTGVGFLGAAGWRRRRSTP